MPSIGVNKHLCIVVTLKKFGYFFTFCNKNRVTLYRGYHTEISSMSHSQPWDVTGKS